MTSWEADNHDPDHAGYAATTVPAADDADENEMRKLKRKPHLRMGYDIRWSPPRLTGMQSLLNKH